MSDLLAWRPPDTDRHGETYQPKFDYDRLNRQQRGVWGVVASGAWLTLAEISAATEYPEASISARLRDFRNMFGCTVDRRRRSRGTFEYRVTHHGP